VKELKNFPVELRVTVWCYSMCDVSSSVTFATTHTETDNATRL